jgi:hypothetical protein
MSTVTARRRDLILAVVLSVLLSLVWVGRSDSADAYLVPAGEGVDVVYVAVGTNFPDALGIGPVGGANGAPIILVPTDPPIPAVTETELVRLDPQKVVIVGGTAVISNDMQDALSALLPHAAFERLAGSNRYDTNTQLTQSVYPVEEWLSIPPSAFSVIDVGTDTAYVGVSKVFSMSNAGLVAPLHLPHGATILEFKVVGAQLVGNTVHFGLDRTIADSPDTIAYIVPGSPTGDFDLSTTSITNGVVDNETTAYYVYATGVQAGDGEIYSVHIRYRLGTPGS